MRRRLTYGDRVVYKNNPRLKGIVEDVEWNDEHSIVLAYIVVWDNDRNKKQDLAAPYAPSKLRLA